MLALTNKAGEHLLAFAAIHATRGSPALVGPLASIFASKYRYTEAQRKQRTDRILKEAYGTDQSRRKRFFYFADYKDLERQPVRSGWLSAGGALVKLRPESGEE